MRNYYKNQQLKIIEIGKFYVAHDGSVQGHPCYIIWKDDDFNLYLGIRLGTSQNKENLPLIEDMFNSEKSHFYYKRPFLGKRKDFSRNELPDFMVAKELKNLIPTIINKAPKESCSIRRKDRRNFKKLMGKEKPS